TGIDPALAGAQPTRENLEVLFHTLGLVPHEKSRAPNKYMHAYRSGSLTFAHEHSRSTQHLWIPFARFEDPQEVMRRFVTRVYPATKLDAAPYGRHSGLKKFPELATAKLLKISPRTTEEARIVLTMLDR